MKGKIQMIKATAEGEQLMCEADWDSDELQKKGIFNEEGLRKELSPVFDVIDGRLKEMNMRVIASNRLVKRLPAEAQMAINQAIDYLYGKAPKADIVREFEDAQKEAQENEDKAYATTEGKKKGGGKGPVGNA